MIEEQLNIENRTLSFTAVPYEWKLGLGVEITISENNSHIGTIRLLCAEGDPGYEELSKVETEVLVRKGLSGLLENKTDTSIKTMDYWQEEIGKLGFNYVSPIYGSLAKCF